MKPRITSGWKPVVVFGGWIDLHGWYCVGDGHYAWGATPSHAYEEWLKPQWPPGAFIEQHMCPPKPTLCQKLRRFKWWPDEVGNWT